MSSAKEISNHELQLAKYLRECKKVPSREECSQLLFGSTEPWALEELERCKERLEKHIKFITSLSDEQLTLFEDSVNCELRKK